MTAGDNDTAGDLLIREVDEDLRREQIHRLWQRYGKFAIAGALAVVLAVAGYQAWQAWQERQHQAEAARFAAAQDLIAQGKTADAEAALTALAADGHSGFAVAALMRRGQLLASHGEIAAAAATYDAIVSSSAPAVFRDLALLKAAFLTLDTADPAQLEARVGALATASNPWHYTATELLALIAQKRGDVSTATAHYKQLADDLGAPQGIRARAAEMLAALTPVAAAPPTPPGPPGKE